MFLDTSGPAEMMTALFPLKLIGSLIPNLKIETVAALKPSPFSPIVCGSSVFVEPTKYKLFKEEDAVKFWLSDDKNKVPLKLSAKMNFGTFEIEILDYSNIN